MPDDAMSLWLAPKNSGDRGGFRLRVFIIEGSKSELTGDWQWLAAVLEENCKHEESDQAHYEFCKRKLGGEAVEFGFAEGLPAGFLVTKEGVELLRKDGLISDGDPALN